MNYVMLFQYGHEEFLLYCTAKFFFHPLTFDPMWVSGWRVVKVIFYSDDVAIYWSSFMCPCWYFKITVKHSIKVWNIIHRVSRRQSVVPWKHAWFWGWSWRCYRCFVAYYKMMLKIPKRVHDDFRVRLTCMLPWTVNLFPLQGLIMASVHRL